MKLLRLREVPGRNIGPVFKNQSWRALAMVVLVFLGLTGYIAIPKGEATPVVLWGVPLLTMCFFCILLVMRLRLCLRPENWLLKVGNEGLYIHLRSYQNLHLPEDSPTVAFIANSEVQGISIAREDRYLPGNHGRGKSHDRFSYIDIEVEPISGECDLGMLKSLFCKERRLPGSRRDDYPVRLVCNENGTVIRLVWDQIRPGEEKAASFLSERYARLPDSRVDSPKWSSLDADGKEALIASLWEMGHVEDARHLVQLHLGVSKYRAGLYLKEHFEQLCENID